MSRNLQEEIDEFLAENEELLARNLRHGNPEARGFVLALYAQSSSVEPIDRVIELLEDLRDEKTDPSLEAS